MAGAGGGRWILALAAGVAGFAGGWIAGRQSVPAPPPPAPYVNPLAVVKGGESLVLRSSFGTRTRYRVLGIDDDSVLLSVETLAPGQPATQREMRVSRSFFGFLIILEGDVDPAAAEATARDFRLDSVVPDRIAVGALGRTLDCWKVTGSHRAQGALTYWISDAMPVHGLLRVDSPRGTVWELESYGGGP